MSGALLLDLQRTNATVSHICPCPLNSIQRSIKTLFFDGFRNISYIKQRFSSFLRFRVRGEKFPPPGRAWMHKSCIEARPGRGNFSPLLLIPILCSIPTVPLSNHHLIPLFSHFTICHDALFFADSPSERYDSGRGDHSLGTRAAQWTLSQIPMMQCRVPIFHTPPGLTRRAESPIPRRMHP